MLDSKVSWVEPQFGKKDRVFPDYPDESLAEWHKRLGLEEKDT
jgi:hypothetical protein